MSLENNAICAICGKPYRVCHTCQNIKTYTPWRTVTDTLPHYTIYLAIYEYNKTKDKAKAKEELLKCDLSELDSFDKDVKKVINVKDEPTAASASDPIKRPTISVSAIL